MRSRGGVDEHRLLVRASSWEGTIGFEADADRPLGTVVEQTVRIAPERWDPGVSALPRQIRSPRGR